MQRFYPFVQNLESAPLFLGDLPADGVLINLPFRPDSRLHFKSFNAGVNTGVLNTAVQYFVNVLFGRGRGPSTIPIATASMLGLWPVYVPVYMNVSHTDKNDIAPSGGR